MSVSKIKNMLIAALLLVNVFFLSLVLVNTVRAKKITEQMTRQTSLMCSEVSVKLSAKLDGANAEFPVLIVSDSDDARRVIVEKLLGECSVSGTSYESEKGSAYFEHNGDFSFILAEKLSGVPSLPGITLKRDYGDRYVQTVSGMPVFNCTVIPDGTRFNGTLAVGVSEEGGTEDAISAYTALLRFISLCKSGEYFCTEILHIDPGYLLTTSVTGSSELDPVWCISTDTGSVYIDGIGGGVL